MDLESVSTNQSVLRELLASLFGGCSGVHNGKVGGYFCGP